MKASSVSFQAAVLFVIAGMIWGLQMAISGNHAAFPAHAHLNLLGWVSLFMMGVFYHLHPAMDRTRAALVQVWVWIGGTAIQAIGVGMVRSGDLAGEPYAKVGSVIVLASMLLFTWLVFRRERYAVA